MKGNIESLSDHRYICIGIQDRNNNRGKGNKKKGFIKWNIKSINKDMFEASIIAGGMMGIREEGTVESEERRINRIMIDACNNSMRRAGRITNRRAVYWWNEEIAEIRGRCDAWRRRLLRAKKRNDVEQITDIVYRLKVTRKEQRVAIGKAKRDAWDELLNSLEKDPWGRPYKMVLNKIKQESIGICEKMEVNDIDRILEELFPKTSTNSADMEGTLRVGRMVTEITVEEIDSISKRVIKKGMRTPGPDGIPGRLVAEALRCSGDIFSNLYNRCFREGNFPKRWKKARLVLIKKEGKPDGIPSSYRPLCLLNETGKMFERLIKDRMEAYMSENNKGLSKYQYGFVRGRSTVDAIRHVKEWTEGKMEEGRHVMAISLDIRNAFNSLEWSEINRAIRNKGFREYIKEIIKDYLRDRSIVWEGKNGRKNHRKIERGAPQGSILGPLLWDITYDSVIATAKLRESEIVCYADDTMILVGGWEIEGTIERGNLVTEMVVRKAGRLGLEVSAGKTQAMLFRRKGKRKIKERNMRIEGQKVELRYNIKYLRLLIKDDWSFKEHLQNVAKKAEGIMGRIGRLMVNKKGPSEKKRKLYCNVINSIILYGAPIWEKEVRGNTKIVKSIVAVQRKAALRVTRAYKTVSTETALIMARNPPVDLLAAKLKAVYDRKKTEAGRNIIITERGMNLIRRQEQEKMIRAWKDRVKRLVRRETVKGELLACFDQWMGREHGELTYWATQMITGHGCFRAYTHRIGESSKTSCDFCEAVIDDNLHNLIECKEWAEERNRLAEALGYQIRSLGTVLREITGSEGKWRAFMEFCDRVMSVREEREREEHTRERRERLVEEAAELTGAVYGGRL